MGYYFSNVQFPQLRMWLREKDAQFLTRKKKRKTRKNLPKYLERICLTKIESGENAESANR